MLNIVLVGVRTRLFDKHRRWSGVRQHRHDRIVVISEDNTEVEQQVDNDKGVVAMTTTRRAV